MIKSETIAAISTALGRAGIGIVRISGKDAINIISKIFKSVRADCDILRERSHTVHYGTIVDGEDTVDEALVLIMRGPHTYTREDTAEIDCHGGIYVIRKILNLVIQNGARLAEPGEFTRRAFENGRIDLSQAEAVIDVINAEGDLALKSALSQLRGNLSERIRNIRKKILEQTAYIEAALDDPEHYDLTDYGKTLLPIVKDIKAQIDNLASTFDDGKIIKEGIKTAILGKPNVGKSTFMNALLEEDRAIVTEIAGTTRDVLEESVRLGDLVLRLADTAGIRKTEDVIERTGVEKAQKYAKEADFVVFLADASRGLDADDLEILDIVRDKKKIVLLNKSDLGVRADTEDLSRTLNCPVIECALKERNGLEEFIKTAEALFHDGQINTNDQIFITNIRQREKLLEASLSLKRTCKSISENLPEDFFTIDMMDAYVSLGEIIGETIEDDLADEIFSRFCMGK